VSFIRWQFRIGKHHRDNENRCAISHEKAKLPAVPASSVKVMLADVLAERESDMRGVKFLHIAIKAKLAQLGNKFVRLKSNISTAGL